MLPIDDRRTSPASAGPRTAASPSGSGSSVGEWLTRELFPVAGGEFGFAALVATLALHLWIVLCGPDSHGQIFRSGVLVEAFAQSCLLVLPGLAFYGGLRSIRRDRDAVLPYLSVLGGGTLGALTWAMSIYVSWIV